MLILAGPIVRRVEPTLVSVWVALLEPATVELSIWASARRRADATDAPLAVDSQDTRAFGNLHVAVVTIHLDPATPLVNDTVYSYDLAFFRSATGGSTSTLASEGLLTDGQMENGRPHLALGYGDGFLPTFVTAPTDVKDLRLTHGSCRRPHHDGHDAMAALDRLIDPTAAPPAGLDRRPHQLFLTGDQIYADDVSLVMLPYLNTIGNTVIGQAEDLPVGGTTFPATLDAFPATLRQRMMRLDAAFTSTAGSSHLLSFAEFAMMYAFCWSNSGWPATLDPAVVNVTLGQSVPDNIRSLFDDKIDCSPDDNGNECRRCYFNDHLPIINDFLADLPRVRRALANISTYMIFDDHEVTDDWNLTLQWKKKVLAKPLGVRVLRNALFSYAVFQGWGNDPDAFEQGGVNEGLLEDIGAALADDSASPAVERRLGLDITQAPNVAWHFTVNPGNWNHAIVALDSRTHRGFRSELAPPALIDPAALAAQVPAAALGADLVIVLAGAPVIGVPVIEEMLYGVATHVMDLIHGTGGPRLPPARNDTDDPPISAGASYDLEAWSMDPVTFEALLKGLAVNPRVIILSGDVHFAHSAGLSYWPQGADPTDPPSRIAQFTSSGFKNAQEAWLREAARSAGFGAHILRSGAVTERLAWEFSQDDLLDLPAGMEVGNLLAPMRARLRRSPVLLPTIGWPGGVKERATKPADWRWRMTIAADERPDSQRPTSELSLLSPPPANPTLQDYPAIATYHATAARTVTLSRQLVFSHNLGVVAFEDSGTGSDRLLVAQHTLFAETRTDTNGPVFEPLTIHRVPLTRTTAQGPETLPTFEDT